MKKVFLSIVALAALVALPMSVSAQSAGNNETTATATTAKAIIVNPIKLENTGAQPLYFGTVASSTTNIGTVLVPAADAPTAINSNVSLLTTDQTAAKFTITGEVDANYTITLPAAAISLTGSDGGDPMTVDQWTCDLDDDTELTLAGGTQVFYVGGTLNVGQSQKAGTYTGTFNVYVNYN